jgi:DNA-binding NarL/FixJ family response regulator
MSKYEKIDDQMLSDLVSSFRKSLDIKTRNKLILFHLGLALSLLKGKRDYSDVALLALTEAVERAPKRLVDNNITPYIASFIKSRLRQAIYEDSVVRIPYSTQRKNKLKKPKISKLDVQFKCFTPFLIDEAIGDLDLTIFEEQILRLRLEGYVDQEIADKLKCSQSKVYKTRLKIQEKWKKL